MSCEYAVQVTVVTPAGNGSSVVFRVQLSPLTSQLYMALPSLRVPMTVTLAPPLVLGVPRVTVRSQLLFAVTSWLAGQLMVGGLVPLSVTVTVKLQLPPLVAEVTLTVVVPTGKNEPDKGLAVTAPQSPEGSAEAKVTRAPRTELSVVLAVALRLAGQTSVQVVAAPLLLIVNSPLAELSAGCNSAVGPGASLATDAE